MGGQKVGEYPLIISTRSGYSFARKLERRFQEKYVQGKADLWIPVRYYKFANKEGLPDILRHIRGEDVYLVADCGSHATKVPAERKGRNFTATTNHEALLIERNGEPVETTEKQLDVGEQVMEMLQLLSAARDSVTNKGSITVVLPCLPYARQDKRYGRQCLSLQFLVALMRTSGADNVLSMDAHQKASGLAFQDPLKFDNLKSGKTFIDYLTHEHSKNDLSNAVFVAPDANAFDNVKKYAEILGTPATFLYKNARETNSPNQSTHQHIQDLALVKGRDAYLVDDMLDTSGTMIQAAEILKKNGAQSVTAIATHGVLSSPAITRLDVAHAKGILKRVMVTDSVTHRQEILDKPWLETVSVVSYFALAIQCLNRNKSVSGLLQEFGTQ